MSKVYHTDTVENFKFFIEQMERHLLDATGVYLMRMEDLHPGVIDVECEEVIDEQVKLLK